MRSQRADVGPQKASFRLERADLRLESVKFRFVRPNLRSERTNGPMDGQTKQSVKSCSMRLN